MEGDNIFYILLAIAYFIYQAYSAFKKGKTKEVQEQDDSGPMPPNASQDERQPPTFRELISEFGAERNFEKQPYTSSQTKTTAQRMNEKDERINKEVPVDEEAQRRIDEEEKALKKVMADLDAAKEQSRRDVRIEHEHFQPYELQSETGSSSAGRILKILQSPEGAKDAIVLGEILNRKF